SEYRRRVSDEQNPSGDFHRKTGHGVAEFGIAISADLSRPAERQSHRSHAEARRYEARLSTVSRRQLSRGRYHRHALRLEEELGRSNRTPHASRSVALPLFGWLGTFGVSPVVRGFAYGTGAWGVCRECAAGRIRETGRRSATLRSRRAG